MSRSSKKGPYIDQNLLKKVLKGKQKDDTVPIKTWARASQIPPDFVGSRIAVHNGRKFIEIFITESMVGHRLGEFAPTRTFRGHGQVTKRILEKT
ncbi:30S ribosomal protein S19 [Candidatus Gottesmanbacteria bacterium RIFCSPHIGHO2_02_FULL_40_24]|uniref:Small ribosomal subunit protein uS19 n=2 Tax=Microgenomates group TaxID=1794810 RepID=A0A1F5Z6H8_9BACT|nr:MAG: 30S ribosomal protein S19 [Candidatus Gottesmanbacteria bacterium RIFCSPHIGHO2_01_FULL_40_15]OGG18217.1 MAG: 30S ribosomal protein S19 [Candidatus Gottesmanbacteria bacterium RIFCSPHIGHO2_02_FULL_40_24]OGG22885.1 MAG: 30S ribosomal protein S19 [Candidatus Gottesmanbacteria bacterium RIFCSPLOWO2_01_FULL_40_10]OGG23501.1 MAG: 30S ribosomal protein S19 [Candidatus Gottesmanbacteria bacterium RIFCSPHIGHO2_12_FULL_40_13]OGG32499.1 MAG: 30S ribosomal protein S19 [Candidatus Gottesmanbacteria 